MFKYNKNGQRINPSVQIATSTTRMFKQSLSLPELTPQFSEEKDINVFDDPLMHYLDPVEVAMQKENDAVTEKSSQIASGNINPLVSD